MRGLGGSRMLYILLLSIDIPFIDAITGGSNRSLVAFDIPSLSSRGTVRPDINRRGIAPASDGINSAFLPSDGSVEASSIPNPTFNTFASPNITRRSTLSATQIPLILVAVAGVLLLVVCFAILWSRRRRHRTPSPEDGMSQLDPFRVLPSDACSTLWDMPPPTASSFGDAAPGSTHMITSPSVLGPTRPLQQPPRAKLPPPYAYERQAR
ncbi:hypothetical protein C8R43DRAFT_1243434 [Mycena crocata]|nr:hypothetical protein C8R43DRAFT_1243434 [Mycena crocata]